MIFFTQNPTKGLKSLAIAFLVFSGISLNNKANAQITVPINTAPKDEFNTWYYGSGVEDAIDPDDPNNSVYLVHTTTHDPDPGFVTAPIKLLAPINYPKITIEFLIKTVPTPPGIPTNTAFTYYWYASDTLISNSKIDWVKLSSSLGHRIFQSLSTTVGSSSWTHNSYTFSAAQLKTGQYLYFMISQGGGTPYYIDNIQIQTDAGSGIILNVDYAEQLTSSINPLAHSIDLTWATATETNNKGFAVERSQDGGKTWSKIGFKASKADNGNSSSTLRYSYTDNAPVVGTNIYRLRQVDQNGHFTYSTTTSQEIIDAKMGIQIYPNPIIGSKLFIKNAPLNATYRIITITGKVAQPVTKLSAHSINTDKLTAGIYFIQIIDTENQTTTLKFIKKQ